MADIARPASCGRGQASIEVVAGAILLAAVGLGCLQFLAVGQARSLADGAAEAGAIALASGGEADAAVREALPGWPASRVDVEASGGRVTVRLRPPSPIAALSRALEVRSAAWARRPSAGP